MITKVVIYFGGGSNGTVSKDLGGSQFKPLLC